MKNMVMKTNHALELKKSARFALVCSSCNQTKIHDKVSSDPSVFTKLCVAEGWRFRFKKNQTLCPDCAGDKRAAKP